MVKHPQNKPSSLESLRALELPAKSFMVMGSGILEALNIRLAVDVDLVVSIELYEHLRKIGWKDAIASNGSPRIEHTIFQAYDHWTDESTIKTLDELLIDAQWVNGVAFNSLAKLSLYKRRRGLEKDLVDLKLIKHYVDSQ